MNHLIRHLKTHIEDKPFTNATDLRNLVGAGWPWPTSFLIWLLLAEITYMMKMVGKTERRKDGKTERRKDRKTERQKIRKTERRKDRKTKNENRTQKTSRRPPKHLHRSIIKIFWSIQLNDLLIYMICWVKVNDWTLVLHSSLDNLVNFCYAVQHLY